MHGVPSMDAERFRIEVADLRDTEIQKLLVEHLQWTVTISPPESCHALHPHELSQPDVTVWSVSDGCTLAGFGALRELDDRHGEVKSMRVAASFLRMGVATVLLRHIIAEALQRGYTRLSLETGSMAEFQPARNLYLNNGFEVCPPFANYREDPNSVYMSLKL